MNRSSSYRNWFYIISQVWSFISLLFLAFMLAAAAFGDEPQVFHTKKELIAFLFFPLGIVLGLFVGLRSNLIGGSISLFCIIMSCSMIPALVTNVYYLLLVIPGILVFINGILSRKRINT